MEEEIMLLYENEKNRHIERIMKHTIQIFRYINSTKIEAHGSGVLVNSESKFFILTAAHVLEKKFRDQLCVFSNNQEVQFIGNRVKCTSSDSSMDIDLGIIELTKNQATQIKSHYQFLNSSKMQSHHQLIEGEFYSVIGFPASKTKIKYGTRKLKRGALAHLTNAISNTSEYSRLTTNPDTNILISYSKNIYNEKTKITGTAPTPYGISGCGLWFHEIENLEVCEQGIKLPYYLVGIMIEWPEKDRTKMKATKIDPFSQLIEQF